MAALPVCRKKLKSIIPLTSLCMNCGALDVSVFFNRCKHCMHNQNEHEFNMLGLLLTEYFTPIDELNAMGNMIREINKNCDDSEVKKLALLQHMYDVNPDPSEVGLSGGDKAKAEDVLSQCTIPPPVTIPPEVSQSAFPVMEIYRNKHLNNIFESTKIKMCSKIPLSIEIDIKFRKIDKNENLDDSEKWEHTVTVKNNSKDKKSFHAELTFFDPDNLELESTACHMYSTSTHIWIKNIEAHQEKKASTIFYLNCKYINQIASSKLIVEIWPSSSWMTDI